MACRHFLVKGKVQGVFFRASAFEQAINLRLSGWVCNLDDGSVEVVACGGEQQLDKLQAWLHEGPSTAQVEDVLVDDWQGEQNYSEFSIR